MKLHLGTLSFASVTLLSLLIVACSSKSIDSGTNAGNGTGATGNTVGAGGSANIGAGGAKATGVGGAQATGTGGAKATGTGGASTVMALGKACPGIPDTTAAAGSGSTTDADAGTQCAGVGVELEPSPLDMFIMMDRSLSMTYAVQNTALQRWDVLQQGVSKFVSDPAVLLKAPRVGIGFFSATGNPNDPSECDPNWYAGNPKVEMEAIATGGPKILQAVVDEYALLGGQTATLPALWGALRHAQAWQKTTPRMTVAILVTDGYPTECDTDMSHVTQVAQEYFQGTVGTYNDVGTPAIRTYVIGVAVDKFNLDAVAQAGGTNSATIIDNAGAVDQFVTAMVNITSANIQCEYTLPTPTGGLKVDPLKVQVVYKPFQGTNQQIPRADGGSCGGPNGGWYFDDPSAPTKVTLCPCSCANLGAGSIEFRFGCYPPVFTR